MILWQTKTTQGGSYATQKSPSSYKVEIEDLDNNTFRSVVSGNMIDTIVSKSWSKLQFNYSYLTEAETQALMALLNNNPLYVKAKDPALGTEYVEMEMRCSKKSCEMVETGDYSVSFNLVQKKKVSGQ